MSKEEQEGLFAIVSRLTEQYTSRESTSVSYETANMLMEAALYCIRETRESRKGMSGEQTNALQGKEENVDIKEDYHKGYELVIDKVKKTNGLYNQMIGHFSSYGNRCYYDTVVKGFPQFFLRYDARFCPQDHLLTLDYPVLKRIKGCGIDLIAEYLSCVALEQVFLYPMGEHMIRGLMSQYEYDYEEAIINLCSPPLRYKIVLELLEKTQEELALTEEDLQEVRQIIEKMTSGELLRGFHQALWKVIVREYDSRKEVYDYLSLDLQDFVIELKNACKYHNERALFPQ